MTRVCLNRCVCEEASLSHANVNSDWSHCVLLDQTLLSLSVALAFFPSLSVPILSLSLCLSVSSFCPRWWSVCVCACSSRCVCWEEQVKGKSYRLPDRSSRRPETLELWVFVHLPVKLLHNHSSLNLYYEYFPHSSTVITPKKDEHKYIFFSQNKLIRLFRKDALNWSKMSGNSFDKLSIYQKI